MLPLLRVREIRRELDRLPPNLFPEDADGEEDRFEYALTRALRAKGINPYDVLREAEQAAPSVKPEYFRHNEVLRRPDDWLA